MDQPKPIAGLVVVLFVVTVIGGWLYVDTVRNELDARVSALEAERVAQGISDGNRVSAPTLENGWHRVVSGKHSYALMLPPSYHFLESTEDERLAYVLPDPNEDDDNPLPVMTITVTDVDDKEARFGHRVKVGKTLYWLTMWKGAEWEPYDQVIASFQVL